LKNISTKGPLNCRSLGFARDDKGKGDGCMESGCLGLANTLYGTVVLSFVIPSEAEGSAVPRTFHGNVFQQFPLRFLRSWHSWRALGHFERFSPDNSLPFLDGYHLARLYGWNALGFAIEPANGQVCCGCGAQTEVKAEVAL
jgi:hypothetical protein